MIYVLLAPGFEEMEAVAPIDLLRRAGCEVKTVAVNDTLIVTGAHNIPFVADMSIDDVVYDHVQAVVLPGGIPGTPNLEAHNGVQRLLDHAVKCGAVIGAICAAPSILGHKGLLVGKNAICYPGFEKELTGAQVDANSYVVTDGDIVTARGAGVATEFGLELVKKLVSSQTADALREGIQCK